MGGNAPMCSAAGKDPQVAKAHLAIASAKATVE
jgi:hypothetical protein